MSVVDGAVSWFLPAAWFLVLAIGAPAAVFFAARWGVRRARRRRS